MADEIFRVRLALWSFCVCSPLGYSGGMVIFLPLAELFADEIDKKLGRGHVPLQLVAFRASQNIVLAAIGSVFGARY